jgi:hypothetical protein
MSWADRDKIFEWQDFLTSSTRGSSVKVVIAAASGEREIELPVGRLGWRQALRRSWSMQLAGWSFLLSGLLIWVKKQNETTLVNLIASACVFAAFCSLPGYLERDLCIPASVLTVLTICCYLGTQAMIMTLHWGLVFPTPVFWLKRFFWVRAVPWCLYAAQLTLHFLRVFPSPAPTVYVLSALSMLGLFLILLLRLLRTTDPLVRAQLQWVALGVIVAFLPWVLLSALRQAFHLAPILDHYTPLFVVAMPLGICFSILRFRLLDVDWIIDWVVIHAVTLGAFYLLEVSFWNWLSTHYAPQAAAKPLLLALSLSVAMFLYDLVLALDQETEWQLAAFAGRVAAQIAGLRTDHRGSAHRTGTNPAMGARSQRDFLDIFRLGARCTA